MVDVYEAPSGEAKIMAEKWASLATSHGWRRTKDGLVHMYYEMERSDFDYKAAAWSIGLSDADVECLSEFVSFECPEGFEIRAVTRDEFRGSKEVRDEVMSNEWVFQYARNAAEAIARHYLKCDLWNADSSKDFY